MTPCIFHKKDHEFTVEVSLIVVVEGCGQVVRGSRGGQHKALSTASEPPRRRCPKVGSPFAIRSSGPPPAAAGLKRSASQGHWAAPE